MRRFQQSVTQRDADPQDLAAELDPALSDGLSALALETRAAVWLHVVEGLSVREVAATLASSRSRVSGRIRDGIRFLRDFLNRRAWVLPAAVTLEDVLRALPAPRPSVECIAAISARAGLHLGNASGLVSTPLETAGSRGAEGAAVPARSSVTTRNVLSGKVVAVPLSALLISLALVGTLTTLKDNHESTRVEDALVLEAPADPNESTAARH